MEDDAGLAWRLERYLDAAPRSAARAEPVGPFTLFVGTGPWPYYALNVWPEVDASVESVTRPASSSPSVGTVKRHQSEQKDLVERAFA